MLVKKNMFLYHKVHENTRTILKLGFSYDVKKIVLREYVFENTFNW